MSPAIRGPKRRQEPVRRSRDAESPFTVPVKMLEAERSCARVDRPPLFGLASYHYPRAHCHFNNIAHRRLPPAPEVSRYGPGRAKNASGASVGLLFTTAGATPRGPAVKHKDRSKTRLFELVNCASLSTASYEIDCAPAASSEPVRSRSNCFSLQPGTMHQATFDCLGSFAMCGAGEGFFVGQG